MSQKDFLDQANNTSIVLGILENAVSAGSISENFASKVFDNWLTKKFKANGEDDDNPEHSEAVPLPAFSSEESDSSVPRIQNVVLQNYAVQQCPASNPLPEYVPLLRRDSGDMVDLHKRMSISVNGIASTSADSSMRSSSVHQISDGTAKLPIAVDGGQVPAVLVISLPPSPTTPNKSQNSPDEAPTLTRNNSLKRKSKKAKRNLQKLATQLFVCGASSVRFDDDNDQDITNRRSLPLPSIPSSEVLEQDKIKEISQSDDISLLSKPLPADNLEEASTQSDYFVYNSRSETYDNPDDVLTNSKYIPKRSFSLVEDHSQTIASLQRADSGIDTIQNTEEASSF